MRILGSIIAAAVVFSATPGLAHKRDYRHSHNKRYQDCRYDKRNAGHQGTAIGAVAGGAGTAILGGGVGESLLGAGVGALAGNVVGRSTEKCGRSRR